MGKKSRRPQTRTKTQTRTNTKRRTGKRAKVKKTGFNNRIVAAGSIATLVLAVVILAIVISASSSVQDFCQIINQSADDDRDIISEFDVSEINECQSSLSCNFDISVCTISCPLGYETDSDNCQTSCGCASVSRGDFQGDIQFDESDIHHLLVRYGHVEEDDMFEMFSSSVRKSVKLWGHREDKRIKIYYHLHRSLKKSSIRAIEQAVKNYKEKTCIDFEFTESEITGPYVIFARKTGCWSAVGNRGKPQLVSIGRGCESAGIVMHELMHALGFEHEHSRPDRDGFLIVKLDNVKPKYKRNFDKIREPVRDLGTPYDTGSVTQYSSRAFATGRNLNTLTNTAGEKLIGQRKKLSMLDLTEINVLYKCESHIPTAAATTVPTTTPTTTTIPIPTTTPTTTTIPVPTTTMTTTTTTTPTTTTLQVLSSSMSISTPTPFTTTPTAGTKATTTTTAATTTTATSTASATTTVTLTEVAWSEWTQWNSCDETCGPSSQRRLRFCLLKSDNTMAYSCGDEWFEEQSCNAGDCPTGPTTPAIPRVQWTEWFHWGSCIKTCGTGVAVRYRDCFRTADNIITFYECGDAWKDERICKVEDCVVVREAGTWSDWGSWPECTQTCGDGFHWRYRDCLTTFCWGGLSWDGKYCNLGDCPDYDRKKRDAAEGYSSKYWCWEGNYVQGGHLSDINDICVMPSGVIKLRRSKRKRRSTTYTVKCLPSSISFSDLDNDSITDIICRDEKSSSVNVLLVGRGRFKRQKILKNFCSEENSSISVVEKTSKQNTYLLCQNNDPNSKQEIQYITDLF